jgi:hypothetical protein
MRLVSEVRDSPLSITQKWMHEAIFHFTYRPFVAHSVIKHRYNFSFYLFIFIIITFSPLLFFLVLHILLFFNCPLLSFLIFIYFYKAQTSIWWTSYWTQHIPCKEMRLQIKNPESVNIRSSPAKMHLWRWCVLNATEPRTWTVSPLCDSESYAGRWYRGPHTSTLVNEQNRF